MPDELCEYCPFCYFLSRMLKSEAGVHLRNARKEVLLAMRSVLDEEIARSEEKKQKMKKVKVK
ncbi:hypothetical protein AMJ39_01955 [candidate division TA06 bacterium DG_24]|uniref:Uncharacterized protein n=3 Tax=Bacteria division TA06 TaxID=1156500 RepID=A0A0S8JQ74_UNCT6|nr:MAG: hypothetical protein AMJ39_01955 [candidate division TA06 bacterium DG_24]KPK66284.1 MAG: hypothetical protein AMJ82_11920 [candidate division TA06 bacterium SM23_40]KPL10811.1 MAG: hypothetical protein AMJ71_01785 [candidate division TA06 bacterium SM1_40]